MILLLKKRNLLSHSVEKWDILSHTFLTKKSLDAGIQDSSTSISIVVKFDYVTNGDESDKHI